MLIASLIYTAAILLTSISASSEPGVPVPAAAPRQVTREQIVARLHRDPAKRQTPSGVVYSDTCPYTLTNRPEGTVPYVILRGNDYPFGSADLLSVDPVANIAQCADLCGSKPACTYAVAFINGQGRLTCTSTSKVVNAATPIRGTAGGGTASTDTGIIKNNGVCSDYSVRPCCDSLRRQ